jgi:hypothetical protein
MKSTAIFRSGLASATQAMVHCEREARGKCNYHESKNKPFHINTFGMKLTSDGTIQP